MEALVSLIRPENFEQEVIAEEKPVLVLCMPRDIEFAGQLELLEDVARQHGEDLKIGFLEEEFIDAFKKIYDVLGTPTFLIFIEGKEKRRLLGLADHETITAFILNG
jgi:thioredoxin-like negative regulator of GroEL